MKRLLFVTLITNLLLLAQYGNACAAGQHNAEWTGAAAAINKGRCKPANVTLTVFGKEAAGQARFDRGARNINGTVEADGAFGGTIGFQHLSGKFTEDKFEGTFNSFDCAWNMVLTRTRPGRAAFVHEAELTFVDQPRHPRRIGQHVTKPDSARANGFPAQSEPERYSQEWWERQERVDDKLRPKLIICRGC